MGAVLYCPGADSVIQPEAVDKTMASSDMYFIWIEQSVGWNDKGIVEIASTLCLGTTATGIRARWDRI